MRVGDEDGGHASTSASACSTSTGSPSRAHQMKVSRFPFGPGRPGRSEAAHRQAGLLRRRRHRAQRVAAIAPRP